MNAIKNWYYGTLGSIASWAMRHSVIGVLVAVDGERDGAPTFCVLNYNCNDALGRRLVASANDVLKTQNDLIHKANRIINPEAHHDSND